MDGPQAPQPTPLSSSLRWAPDAPLEDSRRGLLRDEECEHLPLFGRFGSVKEPRDSEIPCGGTGTLPQGCAVASWLFSHLFTRSHPQLAPVEKASLPRSSTESCSISPSFTTAGASGLAFLHVRRAVRFDNKITQQEWDVQLKIRRKMPLLLLSHVQLCATP